MSEGSAFKYLPCPSHAAILTGSCKHRFCISSKTWMCSLQFLSPYMSIWHSCCPKCSIICSTKPLNCCPCNHFLTELVQGFFSAHAKWGSVIMRLRIQDSNCRKRQMWHEVDPRCRAVGRKIPGKAGFAAAAAAGVRQCWGMLHQQ